MTEAAQPETSLTRVQRIRAFIEAMIEEVGEHPEVELKLTWRRDTDYHKAEFIKDIQSIANSEIGRDQDKYIVVGVDESTREIKGCSHADFEEAAIRQLLESYLEPSPEFEVLRLTSSAGTAFVVVRIPRQPVRPLVVKREIREAQRVLLAVGQVWTKPGALNTSSTQKRLVASGRELVNMIEVQSRIDAAVNEKLSLLLPQIRLEERTRLGNITLSVPVLTSTDEEFESYTEQVLASNNVNLLKVMLERLREKTILVWGYGSEEKLSAEQVLEIKSADFVPAMQRLVLLGLLLLKFSAPLMWFEKVGDLLVEILLILESLGHRMIGTQQDDQTDSLDLHCSHTVPAVESLTAAFVLAGFELTRRNRIEYVRTLFPRIVEPVAGPGEQWRMKHFFLYWGVTTGWGYPNRRGISWPSKDIPVGTRSRKFWEEK